MSTTAADWFATDLEFRQLCGDAVSEATGEWTQQFAADMISKANQYGLKTHLSDKQLILLCKIADWVKPAMIKS